METTNDLGDFIFLQIDCTFWGHSILRGHETLLCDSHKRSHPVRLNNGVVSRIQTSEEPSIVLIASTTVFGVSSSLVSDSPVKYVIQLIRF